MLPLCILFSIHAEIWKSLHVLKEQAGGYLFAVVWPSDHIASKAEMKSTIKRGLGGECKASLLDHKFGSFSLNIKPWEPSQMVDDVFVIEITQCIKLRLGESLCADE